MRCDRVLLKENVRSKSSHNLPKMFNTYKVQAMANVTRERMKCQ